MNILMSLSDISGVGVKTSEYMNRADLFTISDLINYLPRKYDDYTVKTPIKELKPGKVTIVAKCDSVDTKTVRRGIRITTGVLVDNSSKVKAVWFNQPYRAMQLSGDEEFMFSGNFEFKYGKYQLTNPSVEKLKSRSTPSQDNIVPVYRSIKGVRQATLRKILSSVRPMIKALPETLPESVLKSQDLISRSDAYMMMHFPKEKTDIEKARERIGFEELFEVLLASQLNKQANSRLQGYEIKFDKKTIQKFVSELPFSLTNAQRKSAWQVILDFESKTPMNRMLQGDVGSGKTVVAGLAALQAARAGFQTAFMAPTEILASQHADTLSRLLDNSGVRVGLLTGKVKGKARETLLKNVETGGIDILVGTHALIQKNVSYKNLGFVVIDEQHRFGVKQRQALLSKSDKMPHLLSMTATPIPRSLALTVYGELDISVLDELPANRRPIHTSIFSPTSMDKLYKLVDDELESGRQAYIVCSLIDDNPDNDLKSVEKEYRSLRSSVFKHRKVGLLHGKLNHQEKESVMTDFANGRYDILVSTTVVEVGVDVPNATTIVIQDADRFGLSQLHQLRGRVGRSDKQSFCYLVMSDNSKPSKRLREIEKSNDGFYLSEVDLKLRGPGEVYGSAQHGALNLKIASLTDTKLIARAQTEAKSFIKNDADLLQYKELAKNVKKYQRLTTLN